jgi:two-component system chemotaxis sensor kinase CheA
VLQHLIESFLQEAEDLLGEVESCALSLGTGQGTDETINQLFRAFHTIKGSSGLCGLTGIAGFTHHMENVLVRVREGTLPVTPLLIDLVLKSRDHLKVLFGAEQGGPPPVPGSAEKLIAAAEAFANGDSPRLGMPGTGSTPELTAGDSTGGQAQTWVIRFRPNPRLLSYGGNPISLLRELADLGSCEITASTDEIPLLDAIQPEECYLSWTIKLTTSAGKNAIRDVFVFVEDDSKIEMELVAGAAEQDRPELAEIHAGRPVTAPEAPPAAQVAASATKESSVRVPSARLDRLVNLVGELVINQSRLAQAATQSGASEFTNPVQELERLLAELRDNVLGIRMLPIGTLFGRFRRLVHDLSAELGKDVELVTEGAETEIDKSILDQLGDPLVHCLRNSLDHGVEPPEERVAKGKPQRATIRLAALHTGSDVVVSIQDDGRGIDRMAVRAKAIERNLIAADAVLSDKDVFNLILLPGFSTARQVTNVSGRGVGMDAVKRQIDVLRGSLSLNSEEGKGTQIAITLPLTLAIIDGLLVQVGGDQFIVPMSAVTENVELPLSQRSLNNGRNVISVRGELIPYIDLRQAFQVSGGSPVVSKVVIVQKEEQRVGLVVDYVLGTHQTVIQSLGKVFKNVSVVSGATIMGDGRVALILDVAAIVRHSDRESEAARREIFGNPKFLPHAQLESSKTPILMQ